MKALKIAFGDWSENSFELVELTKFNAKNVTKHLREVAESEGFEDVTDIEFDITVSGDYSISVDESDLSEFGFLFLNLEKMLELNNKNKVLKFTYSDGFEIVDGDIELESLDAEWNETGYSVLTKNDFSVYYYKVIEQ
jgi:hypothetical protein